MRVSIKEAADIFLSCLVVPCHVLSCLLLLCLVLSCSFLYCLVLSSLLSCFILSCLVFSCLVLSCPLLTCFIFSYLLLSCLVLSLSPWKCELGLVSAEAEKMLRRSTLSGWKQVAEAIFPTPSCSHKKEEYAILLSETHHHWVYGDPFFFSQAMPVTWGSNGDMGQVFFFSLGSPTLTPALQLSGRWLTSQTASSGSNFVKGLVVSECKEAEGTSHNVTLPHLIRPDTVTFVVT